MWAVAAGEGAVMVSVSSVFEWSVSRQCLVTWVEMCVSVRLRVCDEEPGAMGIQTVGQKGCHRGQIYGRPATRGVGSSRTIRTRFRGTGRRC